MTTQKVSKSLKKFNDAYYFKMHYWDGVMIAWDIQWQWHATYFEWL